MRAIEVAEVTQPQIHTAIQEGHLDLKLAATRQQHRYVFTQAARDALSRLQFERTQVFALHKRLAGVLRGDIWVRFLNRRLKPAVAHFGLNLKSHSFRVGYITPLLKYAPVQQVAAIVGHSNINCTLNYNRYATEKKDIIELLERAHLAEQESPLPSSQVLRLTQTAVQARTITAVLRLKKTQVLRLTQTAVLRLKKTQVLRLHKFF